MGYLAVAALLHFWSALWGTLHYSAARAFAPVRLKGGNYSAARAFAPVRLKADTTVRRELFAPVRLKADTTVRREVCAPVRRKADTTVGRGLSRSPGTRRIVAAYVVIPDTLSMRIGGSASAGANRKTTP